MRRSNTGLTVTLAFVAIALASLHIVYTVESNRQILQGTFFASGILIMSGGAIYDTRLRLQSHGPMLHDF
ncbi:hypothetical protein QUB74_29315, partial [Microcoleus sp. A2-C2]|uniref:hypothetical protein n=1 Tax=Microcoleus sp. A2-C2 TaxID=2818530 RepID=UPI002FD40F86